jgi:hypothetical protein
MLQRVFGLFYFKGKFVEERRDCHEDSKTQRSILIINLKNFETLNFSGDLTLTALKGIFKCQKLSWLFLADSAESSPGQIC